jgi:hypothetical protein
MGQTNYEYENLSTEDRPHTNNSIEQLYTHSKGWYLLRFKFNGKNVAKSLASLLKEV